jgi:hypothetical protein
MLVEEWKPRYRRSCVTLLLKEVWNLTRRASDVRHCFG